MDRKEYNKTYYNLNRELILKKQKQYRLDNPEKVKLQKKKEGEKNKERNIKARRRYYLLHKERIDKRNKENYKDKKEKYRYTILKRMYGISYEEYNKILESQNNKCAICKQEETNKKLKYLSVDHCHSTNRIRGLLCNSCNRGLGLLKDNSEILTNALNYLIKSKNDNTYQVPNIWRNI